MIKLARSINDIQDALTLLSEFLLDTPYSQAEAAARDREHLGRLAYTIHNRGFIWLAYIDKEPVGILMASIEPTMWLPQIKHMREVVWYVKSSHRQSSIGGRLFAEYCRKGEELIDNGTIEGYFTTRMTTTDNINLEKRGFRLVEQTYLKEY